MHSSRRSLIDPDAVARAEAALAALSGSFQGWMEQEIARLDSAHEAAKAGGFAPEPLEALHRRAHEVKGLGGTYDYPLVTALSASLCRLLEAPEARAGAGAFAGLIEAHIEAVKAVVRDRLRAAEDPTGVAMADALCARVDAAVGPELPESFR